MRSLLCDRVSHMQEHTNNPAPEPQEEVLTNPGFFKQFFRFLRARKLYWLTPLVLLLLLVGALIVVGQSSSVSPFIYALF